ncbi:MAG: hypothetical protein F9K44_13440 [Hyphomicrobiaceae bacterium]|nr:MAG: hypothetical protein F9K44_13440 [Hyphomicrobiaceae bacterium]
MTSRIAVIAAIALATVHALTSAAAADERAPCSGRYERTSTFPPRINSIAELKSLLGRNYWGLEENVTLVSPSDAPSPLVLAVRLPAGSINPRNKSAPLGGMGFRWRPAGLSAEAACLVYHVFLPADFDFNKGGKLPGLFGGNAPAGGKDVDGVDGFSARLMWRANGRGEVYAYIPGKPDGRGQSIERGAWVFPRGKWVRIEQEIVLNAPDEANGHLFVWIDGELRLSRTDIRFRAARNLRISGVMADIFYGGKTKDWAAPKDTAILLSPFELRWR